VPLTATGSLRTKIGWRKTMEWKERPSGIAVHSSTEEPVTDTTRVHMWVGDLDDFAVGGRVDVLSLDERERAGLIEDPATRHRFLASCVFTREVLGHVMGVEPRALRFVEGDSGRPEIAPYRIPPDYARRVHFGLSQAERALVLGLALGHDVGLGLEVVRPLDDLERVAESQFSPEEVLWLRSLPRREFLLEFCRLWTRREALANLGGSSILRPSHPAPKPARTTSFEFALKESLVVGSMAVTR
jgi:4'-phosphopantetheinyl transferase